MAVTAVPRRQLEEDGAGRAARLVGEDDDHGAEGEPDRTRR